MIIFRKSDLDTASDYTSSKGFELRSFVQGPNNPKFSPRRWKKQEFPSENPMTVEFLEVWLSIWNSVGKANDCGILEDLIRIPVGRTNDCVILKDFQSEFQSEKQMTVEF